MSAVHVGGTYKITGAARHTAADDLLLKHVDMSRCTLVDIGASDGSTSLDLLDRLPDDLGAYVIADLYLALRHTVAGRVDLFFDPAGDCVLVVGRRLLAWPQLSWLGRVAGAAALLRARRAHARDEEVVLLNPDVRRRMAQDPRLTARVHDVFQPWTDEPPDVVKVANLLRRLYFSDEEITRALRQLLAALPEGGHLLVVDNPRIEGIDLRGGLFQRRDARFVTVATTDHPPEILELVEAVRLPGPVA
ncbi:MAG: hypothetical protein ABJA89_12725 [Lapillicoccus sp.]